jgi:TM2 domain-containing membrane protein YozV
MRGTILGFDQLAGQGVITGDDGRRYTFTSSEWKSSEAQVRPGLSVDYENEAGTAKMIFLVPAHSHQSNVAYGDEKSYLVAGLLALFLGTLGVHKFYMGYAREGTILLAVTLVSWVLTIIFIGFIGLLATGVIALVEAVIYLTAGQTKFRETYINSHKSWF